MKQSFTKEFMLANRGCYNESRVIELFFPEGVEKITILDIINTDIRIKDKYWFLCRKAATKEENQQIAINVAEIVLPIYEKEYPDNKVSREAIKAAKMYITGQITLSELLTARKAAADSAAYADAAAAAAADAAYAADSAAYAAAAADAAYAAAAYAYAAYAAYAAAAYADAADAAAIKQQLIDYLKTFIIPAS